MNAGARPRPVVTPDVAFLYEGFGHRDLRIQHCDDCGLRRHPPMPSCPSCRSPRWTARNAQLAGRVHSYTVHHHPPIPPFPTPHGIVLVDMADGFRFLASIRGVAPDRIRIGAPVELRFVEIEPDFWLPVFEPADGAPA